MNLIINYGDGLFRDTVKACMTVVTRLISRVEPTAPQLDTYIQSLSILSQHADPQVSYMIFLYYIVNITIFLDL